MTELKIWVIREYNMREKSLIIAKIINEKSITFISQIAKNMHIINFLSKITNEIK